jgi:hypothetical protein
MHYSVGTKLFIFLSLLLLGLVSFSTTSPMNDFLAISQSASIPPDFNATLIPPSSSSNLMTARQQVDWTLNIYWQSQQDGSYVPIPICDTNYEDRNMCSVGYFTSDYLSYVSLPFLLPLPSPLPPSTTPKPPKPLTPLPVNSLDMGQHLQATRLRLPRLLLLPRLRLLPPILPPRPLRVHCLASNST